MNQNIWGPHMWITLHTISFNYPDNPVQEDKIHMTNFLNNLQYIIPCSVCKKNYKRHLKEVPFKNKLNNRNDFIKWMIDLHNYVNIETGKRLYSYNEVINIYENKFNIDLSKRIDCSTAKCLSKNNKYKKCNTILCILVLLIIIILIIYLCLKNKKL